MESDRSKLDDILKELVSGIKAWIKNYPPHIRRFTLDSNVDYKMMELIDIFISSTSDNRKHIISYFTADLSFYVLGFADIMAHYAVRNKSKKAILQGLIALIFEGGKVDYRDNYFMFGMFYHAAKRIGEGPVNLFTEASGFTIDNKMHDLLLEYPNKPYVDYLLYTSGYVEDEDEEGNFVFRQATVNEIHDMLSKVKKHDD
jgi:hypothetical protein